MNTSASTPTRLTPHYVTSTVNAPVLLYNGPARLEQDGNTIRGNVVVEMRWAPIAVRQWEFSSTPSGDGLQHRTAQLHLDNQVATCKVQVLSRGPTARGVMLCDCDFGFASEVRKMDFHLANFPNVHDASKTFRDEKKQNGKTTSLQWSRLVLPTADFTVTIDPVQNIFDLESEARAQSGYAITAVGRIERSDGSQFKTGKGRDIAKGVGVFLSFALARWCQPLLLVGLDSTETKGWESWGPEAPDSWTYPAGWFDQNHGDWLAVAFPGFLARWEKLNWRQPLQDAVHWFIEATKRSPGTDGAIALGQIALEMLSWLVLVEDAGIIDDQAFDKLPASDKIRMLLAWCSVPMQVPNELQQLTAANRTNKESGPEWLTKIRNWTIHAHAKNRSKLVNLLKAEGVNECDVKWDVYQLMKWYIQLVLLNQFQYSGKYASHLVPRKLGDCTTVPWST